jgi:DNA-binding response OmpR family regulator
MNHKSKLTHIFCIEDNDDHFFILEYNLKRLRPGIIIQRLPDGEKLVKGMEPPEELKRGLVLLDVNMPKYSGIEVLIELRKRSVWNSIPIVILTTSDSERDLIAAKKAGADGYLIKPMEAGGMEKILASLMDYAEFNHLWN